MLYSTATGEITSHSLSNAAVETRELYTRSANAERDAASSRLRGFTVGRTCSHVRPGPAPLSRHASQHLNSTGRDLQMYSIPVDARELRRRRRRRRLAGNFLPPSTATAGTVNTSGWVFCLRSGIGVASVSVTVVNAGIVGASL